MESSVVTDDGVTMTHPFLTTVEEWIANHRSELPVESTIDVALLRYTAHRLVASPFTNFAATHRAFYASFDAVRAYLRTDNDEDPFDALTRRLQATIRD